MTLTLIFKGVIVGLATAAIIALIGIISRPIRNWLFYEIIEHNLEYYSDFGSCRWDVQWETERFTLSASKAHNDHLEDVKIKLNQAATWSPKHKKLYVSRKWDHPKGWTVGFRLKSIIRTKPQEKTKEYSLVFDIRKRRKWL
jgi:hypothetical protein